MNSDSYREPPDGESFSDALARLRPAKAEIDPATVFYQAGFHACQTQMPSQPIRLTHLVAAGFLAAIVAAPIGYMAASKSRPQLASTPVLVREGVVSPPAPPIGAAGSPTAAVADDVVVRPASAQFDGASWLAFWLGSTEIGPPSGPQSGTTLTAFHSSIATHTKQEGQWPNLLIPNESFHYRNPAFVDDDRVVGTVIPTLAVGDVQVMARTLEDIQ